jgi:fido (protein-threonine AMPylation protein)
MESAFEFFKNTTMKEWIFLIMGGIIGYFINLLFYLRSKNSSNEKNQNRLFDLYDQILKQPNFEEKLQEIKAEIDTKSSLDKVNSQLNDLREKIDRSPKSDDVLKYKLLGDKWSDEYLKTIKPKILTNDGYLFYLNLLEFHKTIFPPDFAWAGKIRSDNVLIKGSTGTILTSSSKVEVEYYINPIPHQEVFEKTERFCNKWNINVSRLLEESQDNKIDNLAKIHHEFQIIHPFIDGNGRVGRVLLNDMLEYLLNKKLNVNYEREDYYAALRSADLGNIKPLRQFILEQIKK